MLVALDGSKIAEVVFSYARELSGRLGMDLDLLHVCTEDEAHQLPMCQAYIEHMAEILKTQSEEIRSKEGTDKKHVNATAKTVVGYPAEEILKYAEENNVDTIMLATHGSSGIRRWGLGSIAEKVIHAANVPVWLIPAGLHQDILYDKMAQRSLLVPLDGSKLAEEVIPHVIALAEQRGVKTTVALITVSKPVNVKLSDEDKELIGKDIESMPTTGELYLKKIANQIRDAGLETEYEPLVGDPAEEIVRYAASYQPMLIVMSTHGRSGFSRFVFGSVTENVLHRLQKTPMFLIRSSQTQDFG
jgi:nucleotide-binding universal stress UspA family protein